MKKFIISTDRLKPILNKLAQAISKNSTLPILTNLYCKIGTNEVVFITSDLELTMLYKSEAETTGGKFEMLIPFDFFKKMVGLTKSAPLEIELKGRKGIIHGVNDVYELGTLDKPEDFPILPEMPKQNFISMNGTFIPWLNKALIAVSSDDTRPAMQKICLDIMDNGMTMVATDAHILFTRSFEVESKTSEQLLISPKIAKALDGFTTTSIYWKKTHIGFQCDDITIIATRHEDKYPNYKAIIPSFETNLLVDKDDLERALEKCNLNSDPLKLTILFLKKTKGTLSFESFDLNLNRKIDVDIPGSYTGDVETVSISSGKLLSLLSQVDYDKVRLAIQFKDKAILLTADNDKDYMGLIMPIDTENKEKK